MNNEKLPSSIQEKVQARIQAGDLRPRARVLYVLRMVSVCITAFLALAATLAALSFIFYSVYESGEAFLLGFGQEGIAVFFMLFPWTLVAIAVLLLALFQWRLSSIVPTYRVPVLPLFAILIIAVVGIGFLLAPVHNALVEHIEEANLPLVSELYESVYESREGHGVYRGIVVSVEENGVWMVRSDGDADHDDGPRFVVLPETTQTFDTGYEVFVLGTERQDIIYASNAVAFPSPDK